MKKTCQKLLSVIIIQQQGQDTDEIAALGLTEERITIMKVNNEYACWRHVVTRHKRKTITYNHLRTQMTSTAFRK